MQRSTGRRLPQRTKVREDPSSGQPRVTEMKDEHDGFARGLRTRPSRNLRASKVPEIDQQRARDLCFRGKHPTDHGQCGTGERRLVRRPRIAPAGLSALLDQPVARELATMRPPISAISIAAVPRAIRIEYPQAACPRPRGDAQDSLLRTASAFPPQERCASRVRRPRLATRMRPSRPGRLYPDPSPEPARRRTHSRSVRSAKAIPAPTAATRSAEVCRSSSHRSQNEPARTAPR